jgi:hypothetical protein
MLFRLRFGYRLLVKIYFWCLFRLYLSDKVYIFLPGYELTRELHLRCSQHLRPPCTRPVFHFRLAETASLIGPLMEICQFNYFVCAPTNFQQTNHNTSK